MMKKMLLALLAALLVLGSCCMAELPENLQEIESSAFEGDVSLTGVLSLPDNVTAVGSRAFAGTGLHALLLPEGCQSLAADVLADTQAVYVLINGPETAVSGDALTGVPYVFGPESSAVSGLSGFYATETLWAEDGFFYSIAEDEAIPLCVADPASVGAEVTLPKLVSGKPVRSLDTLLLTGCNVTTLQVPSYLEIPEGMTAQPYNAMSVTAPTPDTAECTAGDPVTWTTEITGAYGDVSYVWTFDTQGIVSSLITAEPTVTFNPMTEGVCYATVTVIDALNDQAAATAETGVTVSPMVPIYRALLVGNTYPGTDVELPGCDTDVYAVQTVLRSMTSTAYAVNTQLNINASGIQSAIASTFAGARPCDVSLFYFSGHGTTAGSLVGIGNSTVSVGALRSWLDEIPGTKIVIIDACYSGNMISKSTDAMSPASFTSAFISGFSSYTKANDLANNGYIVMTACSKDQMSSSLTAGDISFGAFTYGLCYGSGYDEWNQAALGSLPADTDSNGEITLLEAYTTAVDRVNWFVELGVNIEQSAQYYGDDAFVLWKK